MSVFPQKLRRNKVASRRLSLTSSKKFCFPEDIEKRNSETKTNEKNDVEVVADTGKILDENQNTIMSISSKKEIQKDEKETLQCVRAMKKRPEVQNLRSWPIFNLLKPEFIPQIHTVVVYGSLGNRAIIVTKNKTVIDLGGTEDGHSTGTQPVPFSKEIAELCGKNIKTFAHSLYFILALTKEGEVYFWEFKKPVSNERSPVASTPIRVPGFNKKCIVDIACGNNHSLALTSDGKVYVWEENNYGQIRIGNSATFYNEPRQVKFELEKKNVIHIACGLMFNMVITDENKLYGWGNNKNGQISIDNTSVSFTTIPRSAPRSSNSFSSGSTSSNVPSPKYVAYPREIITISDEIVKLACGYRHTLALSRKGKIYAWGDNSHGQLGVGHRMKPSGPIMVKTPQMEEMLDIAAYGNLSVAVECDKTIYVWGDCFGQYITTPLPTIFSRIHDPFAYNNCSHAQATECVYEYL